MHGALTDQRRTKDLMGVVQSCFPCSTVVNNYHKDGTCFRNWIRIYPLYLAEGGNEESSTISHFMGIMHMMPENLAQYMSMEQLGSGVISMDGSYGGSSSASSANSGGGNMSVSASSNASSKGTMSSISMAYRNAQLRREANGATTASNTHTSSSNTSSSNTSNNSSSNTNGSSSNAMFAANCTTTAANNNANADANSGLGMRKPIAMRTPIQQQQQQMPLQATPLQLKQQQQQQEQRQEQQQQHKDRMQEDQMQQEQGQQQQQNASHPQGMLSSQGQQGQQQQQPRHHNHDLETQIDNLLEGDDFLYGILQDLQSTNGNNSRQESNAMMVTDDYEMKMDDGNINTNDNSNNDNGNNSGRNSNNSLYATSLPSGYGPAGSLSSMRASSSSNLV